MDFDQLFESWRAAQAARDDSSIEECVRSARRLSSSTGKAAWDWFDASLQHEDRKWFVAAVFDAQPLPKRLFDRMLHTGVLESNPSFNRQFIEPCVESFGSAPVLSGLLRYLQAGTGEEKAGAASAAYWVPQREGDVSDVDVRLQIHCEMLRQFVNNESVEVRRRIIPMLALDEARYPADIRALVARATQIARSHPDSYIKHRIEIQLGAGGPFMPIPTSLK